MDSHHPEQYTSIYGNAVSQSRCQDAVCVSSSLNKTAYLVEIQETDTVKTAVVPRCSFQHKKEKYIEKSNEKHS